MAAKKMFADDIKKIINMYRRDKLSTIKIAAEMNVSTALIYQILKRNGIELRTRSAAQYVNSPCRHEAFDNLESDPVTQFWAGVIATDGSLRNDGVRYPSFVHLNQSIKNQDLVRKIADWWKCAITEIREDGLIIGYQSRLLSQQAVDKLMTVGIHPNKTFTVNPPDWLISNPHFMRGAICGNGWINSTVRPTEIGICGASLKFLDAIKSQWVSMVGDANVRFRVLPAGRVCRIKGKECQTATQYSVHVRKHEAVRTLLTEYFEGCHKAAVMDRKKKIADKILAHINSKS